MNRAVLLMLIGMSLIPAGDSANKILTTELGVAPLFVSFSRFAIGAVCILPFVINGGWGVFRDPWIWVRGILIGMAISSITFALQTVDLATAFGGLFFAPIVSFVTAAIFLREPVTPIRAALMVAGFIGVIMVAQPGLNFTPGTGFALLAGTLYGLFLTVSRLTAPRHAALPQVFSQLLIAAVLVSPFGLANIPEFNVAVTAQMLMSALFSMTGNLLLIMAYATAPATRLAPLVYFQLIAALVLGWQI
ncbi:MAG: DMT family transporter, partial [Pseudomonadota bacterium]